MADRPDPVQARREMFLRQMIAHHVGIIRTTGTELAAHADASVNAWWAYRLLEALTEHAPNVLPALLADIGAELEMGEAADAAWETALAVGIDPDALTAHMEARYAAAATPKAPSRFRATPAEINEFLLAHFAEDTLLRYQQAVGGRAVEEAAKDLRVDTNLRQLEGMPQLARYGRELADLIDPLKGGGHYPSALITWPTTTPAPSA